MRDLGLLAHKKGGLAVALFYAQNSNALLEEGAIDGRYARLGL